MQLPFNLTSATILLAANIVLISAIFLYIYNRAGSTLFIRDKLWRVLGGKTDFSTPAFQKLKEEARELEHFKFEFNVPATSLEEAKEFEKWVAAHNLPLFDILSARNYIDWTNFKSLKLKKTNFELRKSLSAITALLSYIFMVASCALATPNYFVAKLPNTKSFYVSETKIKFSIFTKDSLTIESCKSLQNVKEISRKFEFPLDTLKDICKDLENEAIQKKIRKEITTQRIAVGSLGVFLFLFFIHSAKTAFKISAAIRLRARLSSPTDRPTQNE